MSAAPTSSVTITGRPRCMASIAALPWLSEWEGSTKLLAAGKPILHPADFAHHPLIHVYWPEWQIQPPTWQQWLAVARSTDRGAVAVDALAGPSFREELHAIDAVIAGQGIGVVSDVLAARELATGELVKVLDLSLPGFGFYVAHIADHPRRKIIDAFTSWLRSVA